jgi:hypothetical protein
MGYKASFLKPKANVSPHQISVGCFLRGFGLKCLIDIDKRVVMSIALVRALILLAL